MEGIPSQPEANESSLTKQASMQAAVFGLPLSFAQDMSAQISSEKSRYTNSS